MRSLLVHILTKASEWAFNASLTLVGKWTIGNEAAVPFALAVLVAYFAYRLFLEFRMITGGTGPYQENQTYFGWRWSTIQTVYVL